MSARAARLLAVPFVLLACALRFAEDLWLQTLTWGIEPGWAGLLVAFAVLGVTLGAPLAGYLLVTRQARKRPAAWEISPDGRRFVAGSSPAGMGASAVIIGWMAGGLVPTERVPGEDQKRIAELGAFTTVMTVLAVLVLVFALWLVVGRWPWLEPDREAVTIKRLIRVTRTPWDEVPADLREIKVPGGGLHIAPKFLGFTLQTYQTDPARRDAIGTESEAARLAHDHQP
ncbi:hypothetical protein [Actinoplanes sp. NPDC026670]|uniref:hypothetical protein n=1 Tax=Actinoplanes sp. NPDC026670 TaxID=3154700 RepID=UPI00340B7FFA